MSYYKTIGILILAIFLILFSKPSDSQVKGKCKDCHTMHYSYEGKEVTYSDQKGPFPSLTIGGCVGCHGQFPDGTQNIIVKGKSRIPQVIHNMKGGDLAGGNFYYVADKFNPDYKKGHNVLGISSQENPPKNVPMGFMGNVIIPGGRGPTYWPLQKQLVCSGTWGCHGDRTIENPYKAIYGAHHEDDSVIDGSTVGKSYRFLYGIKGKEHKNWEYLASESNHNGYKGDVNYDSMDTISYLCGECHSLFHPHIYLGGSEVGSSFSLWKRHPSDISFSKVHHGYAHSEYEFYKKYNLSAPVAYFNPTGEEEIVDSNSIVMCLSCHKAHASEYEYLLRWDYSRVSTKTPNYGCLICHTDKVER